MFTFNFYMPTKISSTAVSSTKRGLKPGYDRVTFIIRDDIAYRLNCIASIEDVFIKEVVNDALESFIKSWENKNGTINRPKRK